MVKEGGIHVAYQPLSRLIGSLTTRLGRVKQVIISYRRFECVNFKDRHLQSII